MKHIYCILTFALALTHTNNIKTMDSLALPKQQSPTIDRSLSTEEIAALLKSIHEQEKWVIVLSPSPERPAQDASIQTNQLSTIQRRPHLRTIDDSNTPEEANTSGSLYEESTIDFGTYQGEEPVDFVMLQERSENLHKNPDGNQYEYHDESNFQEESYYGNLDKSSFQEATINAARTSFRYQAGNCEDIVFIRSPSDEDFLPLLQAAEAGNRELIQQLLAAGESNLNDANELGETALHFAAFNGFTDIAADLLKAGAKIDAVTVMGETALHYAALKGNTGVIDVLLNQKAGIDIQAANGWAALHYASWHGHLEAAAILIIKGANPALTCTAHNTPLHFAAWRNHPKIASALISNKAPLTAANSSGATPLHYAAYQGILPLIELIYSEDTNLQRVTLTGNTPLHCAAWRGHLSVVAFLHANGAATNALNINKMTALKCAMNAFKKKLTAALDTTTNGLYKKNSSPLTARKQEEYQQVIAFLSTL